MKYIKLTQPNQTTKFNDQSGFQAITQLTIPLNNNTNTSLPLPHINKTYTTQAEFLHTVP